MNDEDAIRRTLAEYAQFCDDERFDEWADLYTEYCRFSVMGNHCDGREVTKASIVKGQQPELRGKHIFSTR